jgi:polygalacturonase
MSGGVRNIKIDNCNFIGTDIGLRFKSNRGRGGVVENIFISNIFMKEIPTDALSFNMYYGGFAPTEDMSAEEKSKGAKAVPVTEETPIFRNISMENIYCSGAKDAIVLQGLPEMPITGIEIKNVVLNAERGISIYDADGIKIINSKISSSSPVVKIDQSSNVLIENLYPASNNDMILNLNGNKTKNILVKGNNAKEIKDKTQFGDDVSKDALIVE